MSAFNVTVAHLAFGCAEFLSRVLVPIGTATLAKFFKIWHNKMEWIRTYKGVIVHIRVVQGKAAPYALK